MLLLMKKAFVLRQPEKEQEKSCTVLAVSHRSTAASGKQTGWLFRSIAWMKVKLTVR